MEFTYSSTTVINTASVTLADTSKLIPGLHVYGTGIIPCTKIVTITNATTIQLSKNVTASGTVNLIYSDLNPNQWLERCNALKETQAIINEVGAIVSIIFRDEDEVTRDKYGSVKRKTQSARYNWYAFPIIMNPTTQQLEKAGLRENSNAVVTLGMQNFIDNSLTIFDLDQAKTTFKVFDQTFEIKEVTKANQFGNVFLNVNVGLFKK